MKNKILNSECKLCMYFTVCNTIEEIQRDIKKHSLDKSIKVNIEYSNDIVKKLENTVDCSL